MGVLPGGTSGPLGRATLDGQDARPLCDSTMGSGYAQDLDGDVVRAAALLCGVNQGIADFSCSFPGDRTLNLGFAEQTPQTVGAEHQRVP